LSEAEFQAPRDLFGDPVRAEPEGPGRPEHQWSLRNSNRINLLFATGHSVKEAALAIGVSVPTLRKHYFSEVEQWRVARLKLTAAQLERLNDEAEQGNVAAIKELFKRIDKATIAELATRVANRPEAKPKPAGQKLGKKAELRRAAGEVKGKFKPPEPPQLLN
jgi:hypothetical protein